MNMNSEHQCFTCKIICNNTLLDTWPGSELEDKQTSAIHVIKIRNTILLHFNWGKATCEVFCRIATDGNKHLYLTLIFSTYNDEMSIRNADRAAS